jgi:uncharacterized protein
METTENKNTATLLQLSAYAQYFFPLGNYILPVVIWSARKDKSEFVNFNGRQAINFQLSLLIYIIALLTIAVPIFAYTLFRGANFTVWCEGGWHFTFNTLKNSEITGWAFLALMATLIAAALKVFEFVLILVAAIKNSNGENYKFPLTINFIK